MAKVRAIQRGYFGGMLREPWDVFEVPDGSKASWWVPVGDADPEPAPAPAVAKGKAKRAEAITAEPFADAPAPVRVENAVNAALGATQPDWIAPGQDI